MPQGVKPPRAPEPLNFQSSGIEWGGFTHQNQDGKRKPKRQQPHVACPADEQSVARTPSSVRKRSQRNRLTVAGHDGNGYSSLKCVSDNLMDTQPLPQKPHF
ncbi:hypothetical protein CB1_000849072 [Camelus ferus]|nr:hypothetical protein CB1_000849072 [Camelus ferus]